MVMKAVPAPATAAAGAVRPDRSTVRIAWGAAALWMAMIFLASSDGFAEARTEGWLRFILAFAVDQMDPERFVMVHAIVRKAAHFVEYAMLGVLNVQAFRVTWLRWPPRRWWGAALMLAVACAVADELHQAATLRRTGSARDVLLDASGAFTAVTMLARLHTGGLKRRSEEAL